MRSYLPVIALAAAHFLLAIWFASVTPYRAPGYLFCQRDPVTHGPAFVKDIGAPDERQHANYVQSLIGGHGFPVFKVGDPNLYESYQSHQAPLYYIIAAGFSKIVGVSDVDQPEGVRLRWLNALIGAGTVLGVYFLCFWGFGRSDVGLVAASFAAFLPMLIGIDSAITNDALLYCLLTWTLATLAKGIAEGWNWRLIGACAVLTGLSLNTKTTALSLLPLIFLAAFLGKRVDWKMAGAILGGALLIAAPWWIRNTQLYGDPFVLKAFVSGFHTPLTADMSRELGANEYWINWFGWWTVRSFYGAFGYLDIWMNSSGLARPPERLGDHETLYRILFMLTIALSAGWALSLDKPEWKGFKPVHALNFAFFVLVFGFFLKFNLTYFQAQGRYVLPAIGPIAAAIGTGLCFLAKERWRTAWAVLLVLWIGVDLYVVNQLPTEFDKRLHFSIDRPS